jgi:cell division protein FtsI (penicillin-binding protein 3)
MNKRAIILSTAVVFGFVLVVLRLADLMLINHDRLAAKARLQHLGEKDIQVRRGNIYDRRGRELAVNLDVESAYCDPLQIESPRKAASVLAKVTGKSYRTILKRVSSKRRFAWIQRKLDADTARKLKSLQIKGLGFMPEVKRFYPSGTLASHVIGFVGIDNQALEGIELKYDETLKARPEKVIVARDAGGRMLSEGVDFQSTGNSLVLTIDEGLQYIVEKGLDKAMRMWGASSASAIMMNPFTGEILAMANRPTFDLNNPSSYKASERRNRAITDSYEPGSTFKIVVAAGALEEGLVSPDTEFDCSAGSIEVGGRVVRDTHKHGVITFREVIKTSSNVGAVMVGLMLGKDKLYEYAKRFGFGEKTGIDLPGEASGMLRPPELWSETSLSAVSIGYEVAVTPLQLLRAYSAIANGGFLVKPYIVSKIISPEGRVIYSFRPEKKRAISTKVAETLKEILVSVTQEGGTAATASVDGNRVAGKTGTAKLIDPETGMYSNKKYASSFVGFVPADKPKVALIVVVREPKEKFYGGLVAAPIFKEIADQTLSYLNVPREDAFENNVLVVRARELK